MARVLVPLAQGCEELEAVTVMDLLVRGGVEVIRAGLEPGPVLCGRGTTLLPDTTLEAVLHDDFDMIVLPGGLPGADHLDADPRIHALLRRTAEAGRHVAAICAAPKVLLHAGLLTARHATAYPGTLDGQQRDGLVVETAAVVRDGNIITSRGPGTAMDFALELVEILQGSDQRAEVEAGLQRP